MKRVWRFSSNAAARGTRFSSKPKPIPSTTTATTTTTTTVLSHGLTRHSSTLSTGLTGIVALFTAKSPPNKDELTVKVAILRNELVREASDSAKILRILNENSESLNRPHPAGSVLLELLNQLDSLPSLALQVFNWKRYRKRNDPGTPIDAYEYSKGIKIAGKARNVELAVQLFKEAANKGIKTTGTYNALMGAYMFNGLADKCQELFFDMKKDATCVPSIPTYNILISVFGRLMLVDHMEATLREVNRLGLTLNVSTYNNLIAGYISAWMWDDMERVYQTLKSSGVEPNLKTHLLMIRGYANYSNVEKMEEIYSLVRDHVNKKEIHLIKSMICAYCKSSAADRVMKVEGLLELIPEDDYSPWLNVWLIKLYAREDMLLEMENAINEAFEHKTSVVTVGIMRCIIATYFRCNAVEKLDIFVRRAESAGWKSCRSLYHCKMAMHGLLKQFEEMQYVLREMDDVKLYSTKKTLWIMYKAYLNSGQRAMVSKIVGQMFKHGYEVPLDAFPS